MKKWPDKLFRLMKGKYPILTQITFFSAHLLKRRQSNIHLQHVGPRLHYAAGEI